MSNNFEIEMRVPYAHTDLMATVYYGNYFIYFERARVEYLRHIGFPHKELEKKGTHLTVTETSCRYIRPAHYDDMLVIRPKIENVGRASIVITYEIFDKETKTLLTTGMTKLAFVDEKGKVCAGPGDMIERLKQEIKK